MLYNELGRVFLRDNKDELNKVKGIVLVRERKREGEREDGQFKENWGRRSLQIVMGGDSNSINNNNNNKKIKIKIPFFLN